MPHYSEGTYKVEIIGQGLNKSKVKHTPGFYLDIMPENGAYSRKIQLWITDGTVDNVVRDIKRLGFTGKSWGQLDPTRQGHHSFVGLKIMAVCKHEADRIDSQKIYERWELPYGGKGAEIVKMDDDDTKTLDIIFGECLAAEPTDSKPLTAENIAQEADDVEDDGVPF